MNRNKWHGVVGLNDKEREMVESLRANAVENQVYIVDFANHRPVGDLAYTIPFMVDLGHEEIDRLAQSVNVDDDALNGWRMGEVNNENMFYLIASQLEQSVPLSNVFATLPGYFYGTHRAGELQQKLIGKPVSVFSVENAIGLVADAPLDDKIWNKEVVDAYIKAGELPPTLFANKPINARDTNPVALAALTRSLDVFRNKRHRFEDVAPIEARQNALIDLSEVMAQKVSVNPSGPTN